MCLTVIRNGMRLTTPYTAVLFATDFTFMNIWTEIFSYLILEISVMF
jgi:hypothetical protein